jgi:putative peptide zinc metalloprotease protein
LAIVGGIFFVPTPQRIAARAVIEPRDARRVYVVVPGRIESAVPLGKSVAAGDMLAQLVDLDLDREIVELEGRCRRLEVQLKNLRLLQSDSLAMAGQIPSTETALHEAQQRLAARRRDRDRLVLRAPVAGVVLEPPRRPAEQDAGQLAAWHGHPLDPRNRGALLEEGTLLCLIGPPADSEGMLLIDQGDLGMVSPGERVRLRIDSVPGKVLTGVVDELATSELKTVSHALAKAADLPVRIDEQGAAHPLSATYEARVRLDDPAVDLPIGSHGSARIAAAWEPLYKRMARMLQQSFPSLF